MNKEEADHGVSALGGIGFFLLELLTLLA